MNKQQNPDIKLGVLIVDDHAMLREGIATLINRQPDMFVCAEASDYHEAINALTQKNPDAAIVDISLQSKSGLDLIREMLNIRPALPILVLSMYDETTFAARSIQAGARGYIMKSNATETVIDGIREVVKGELFLSDRAKELIVRLYASGSGPVTGIEPENLLSDRDLQIFMLIGNGLTTRRIAGELNISVKTVESHRARIKAKLGINSAIDLTQRAYEWAKRQ